MRLKSLILTTAALFMPLAMTNASATMLDDLKLGEIVERSDTVFRGTVIDIQQTSVAVGGGTLPTITYRLRVEDMLKGTPDVTKDDAAYMEIQMVGSLKPDSQSGDTIHFALFDDVPKLTMGHDYVLFMTPESSIGLSVTVGLGQGAFNVVPTNKADMVVNEFGNMGLGMGEGPMSYSDLKAAVTAGN